LGALRAIQAAVGFVHGRESLSNVRVAIQGCGAVGAELALQLHAEGAHITVSDLDQSLAIAVRQATGATVATPQDILFVETDVLSPCALGAVITENVAANVNAGIIAGAANNQLASEDVAELLFQRGVTYVPDFFASAGGVISGCGEYFGWTHTDTYEHVSSIGARITDLLMNAQRQHSSPEAYARSYVALSHEMLIGEVSR
jgi:leucine dehydrogenase